MLEGRRDVTDDFEHIITFKALEYSIICMYHDLFHNLFKQFPTKRHAEFPKIFLPL